MANITENLQTIYDCRVNIKEAIIYKGGEVGDLTTYADAIANLPSGGGGGGSNDEYVFTADSYSTMSFYGKLNKLPFPNTTLLALYDVGGGHPTETVYKDVTNDNIDEELDLARHMLGSDIKLLGVFARNSDVTEDDVLNGATNFIVPVRVNILN